MDSLQQFGSGKSLNTHSIDRFCISEANHEYQLQHATGEQLIPGTITTFMSNVGCCAKQ
jgi:hypothetical protein